jgi:tetratricopeptide (TPR) repeat protein
VRALHAALGLRQAFAAFAADLRRTQGTILTMQVGLHAGLVVVSAIGSAGHTGDTALGFTSYLAEISALINLGLDYLALGQYERAVSSLSPTLERVQREAFGVHKWRWQIKLLIGLAKVHYAMGANEHALHAVEEGLKQAQATGSQKYVAKACALRGKILLILKQREAGGRALQRAFRLVEHLHSPSLTYPIAYDLGQWFEMIGKERQAVALYGKAKATIEHMLAAVEDPAWQAPFRQSGPVQTILACAAGVGA